MRSIIILLFAISLILSSCVKEENYENITNESSDPQALVQTSIYGEVRNAEDLPLSNALVEMKSFSGILTSYTDDRGQFFFDSVLVKRSVYIEVEKQGYFEGSRRFSPKAFSRNFASIQLLERLDVGSFDSNSGGNIDFIGHSLSIPSNGVANSDGSNYSGMVTVKMNSIDPSSLAIFEQMPGELSGFGSDGEEAALASYGMLMIELEDENGLLLQLAEDTDATLTFDIPDNLLADAPSEIPLWYFNQEKGFWYEEGSALLSNGTYVGKVSHFTTWNCDKKGDVIDISGQIHCEENITTLPYLKVYIYQEEAPIAGGYLTEDGEFTFLNFYANELFTLKVLDHCDQVVWEAEFGPFSEDTNLDEIVILDCGDQITISGSAVNCDGEPVENGILQLLSNQGSFFQTDFENGSFEIATISCDEADMQIIITDVSAQKSSEPITFETNNGDVTLGTIEVCDELDEYFIIYYELPDGDILEDTILFLDPTFRSYEQEGHFIEFTEFAQDSNYIGGSLSFDWNSLQLGFNLANSFYYSYDEQGSAGEYHCSYSSWTIPPLQDFEVDMTELDFDPNGLIKGTFSGEVKTNEDVLKPISGKFKVRVE